MQLKTDTVVHILGQILTIQFASAFVGKMSQIVCLELDAVQFVQSAQLGNLLLPLLTRHLVLSVLVGGKLSEQVLGGKTLTPLLLSTELLRYGEEGHDRIRVKVVGLHLIQNLRCVGKNLWQISKHLAHLLTGLEPLLLGIEHTGGVVQVLVGGKAEKMVMRLSIVLVHKMHIVGGYHLYTMLLRQFQNHTVHLLLQFIHFTVCPLTRVSNLMALNLQIIVLAPDALEPLNGLLGSSNVARHYLLGYLSAQARRSYDESLVILRQILMVGAWTHVVAIHPRTADQLDKVLVASLVLGKNNKVPAALVLLDFAKALVATTGNIHFTSKYRFERFQSFLLALSVNLAAIVKILLYAEHVAMVGHCHATHAIGNGLIHQFGDTGLSVKERILSMNMKMNEILHQYNLLLIVYGIKIQQNPLVSLTAACFL